MPGTVQPSLFCQSGPVSLQQNLCRIRFADRHSLSVRLRFMYRMKDCIACGPSATVTAESLPAYSYTDFTGQEANDSALPQLRLLPLDQR